MILINLQSPKMLLYPSFSENTHTHRHALDGVERRCSRLLCSRWIIQVTRSPRRYDSWAADVRLHSVHVQPLRPIRALSSNSQRRTQTLACRLSIRNNWLNGLGFNFMLQTGTNLQNGVNPADKPGIASRRFSQSLGVNHSFILFMNGGYFMRSVWRVQLLQLLGKAARF